MLFQNYDFFLLEIQKVFDIGVEGCEIEGDGELLAESEEIPFECASRQKYRMMFQDPIQLQVKWKISEKSQS